ncbi:MAG: ribonuclease P protein component [Alphaproteobacteria bacterium]|nr:MAG: ribonuclease P protein component [Rickettsiaceae bacterium 4572_127]
MSNKLITLKKRSDFLLNRKKGEEIRTPFFILRTMKWKKDEIGLGFVVTKKGIDKRAVIRNKVKRKLRAMVQDILPKLGKTGTAYVFYSRAFMKTADFHQVKKTMAKCLNS